VTPDNALGDEMRDVGGEAAPVLDVAQRRRANREALLVTGVPLGYAGIQIPAVIVEAATESVFG
jgi:hypothetical protein